MLSYVVLSHALGGPHQYFSPQHTHARTHTHPHSQGFVLWVLLADRDWSEIGPMLRKQHIGIAVCKLLLQHLL
jgi:hypothetical protein